MTYNQDWIKRHPGYKTEWRHKHGINKPIKESKNSAPYLGVVIAEKALSKFFNNITRMPYNNKGFDFLCEKGYKIDVKSSCIRKGTTKEWTFDINKNKIADYFLILAFDDRENLTPLHVWLIPGNDVNNQKAIQMGITNRALRRWKKYERPLDKVMMCCNKMKL